MRFLKSKISANLGVGVEIVNVPAFQCYENTYSSTLILDFIWNKLNLSYEKKFTFIP